jgi:hypothetical protein
MSNENGPNSGSPMRARQRYTFGDGGDLELRSIAQ